MDDIVSIIMELRRAERAQTASKGGSGKREGEFSRQEEARSAKSIL